MSDPRDFITMGGVPLSRLAERMIENGADPTGRDIFPIPPGYFVYVQVDDGPVQRIELPAGTLVGEVTVERIARQKREAAERARQLAAARALEHEADPWCAGPTPIYSCGRRRSELEPDETMGWNPETSYRPLPYWSCSSCEAAYDE